MGREHERDATQAAPTAVNAALETVLAASASLWSKLTCPACGAHLGDSPVQSHVCGHTLCAECGQRARSVLSACPVSACRMPARPLDLTDDRTVRDVVSASRQLHNAVAAIHAAHTPTKAGSQAPTPAPATSPEAMRVCVTALGNASLCDEVVAELRALGAELVDWRDGRAAAVVVTPVDPTTHEFAARTRSVHYALACNLPIVDVVWVRACASRGQWLPTKPYEAARPPRTRAAVFEGVCATVACGADLLERDVCNWLRAAGATLLVDSDELPANARMYLYIVPDLADDEDAGVPEERMVECEQRDVSASVRDVPWVSDCLVSQACPPAVQFLETMGETMTMRGEESE